MSTYNDWQRLDIHNPEPIFNKSLIHIRNGRFDIGWLLYEEGLKNNIREPFDGFYKDKKDYWNGVPFDGTLNAEHLKIEGQATGDITAEFLEITGSGNFDGKLKTNSLSVDMGAKVSGNVGRITG